MSRFAPSVQCLARSLRPASPALRLPLRSRAYATTVNTTTPTAPEPAIAAAQPTGAAATSTGSTTAAATASAAEAASATTTTTTARQPKPYFVERNNFNNLSVYGITKRGGNLKQTIVKRADGNLMALKNDLANVLRLPISDISYNNVTKHLVIRGSYKNQVQVYLATCGF